MFNFRPGSAPIGGTLASVAMGMGIPRQVSTALERMRSTAATDPAGVRQTAMQLIAEAAHGHGGGWYELGMYEGEPQPVRWATVSVDEHVLRRQRDLGLPNPAGDPRLAPASRDSRFVLLHPLLGHLGDGWYDHPLYRQCWAPANVADQLRMVVYHRGEFVGWIGTFRRRSERPFSRADLRRVQPFADAVADALLTAYQAERRGDPEGAADIVLRPDGTVDAATPGAAPWLDRRGVSDALRQWVRATDRGEAAERAIGLHQVRWSRLETNGGSTRYLLHLQPIAPVRRHPAHVLSRTQREIAVLAAAGATAPEIAQMLHVAPSTVRTHLKQIYLTLNVTNRAELVRNLDGLPAQP
jgi:DNA-binding CsgD family transcriptional regulator